MSGASTGGALAELRTLLALLRGVPRGGTHGERLERFYGGQAAHYDRFRERLLHGRRRLMQALPLPEGGHLVDLGAGTGRNLDHLGERVDRLREVTLVDLCRPLLAVARERHAGRDNVRMVHADVTAWRPPRPVDAVVFSYVLTMIPDWRAAIENALAMLAPGGVIGVADFYVSAEPPPPGRVRHGALARAFWPRWFAHDGVHLDAAQLPSLLACGEPLTLHEGRGRVPFMCGAHAPYYVLVARPTGGLRSRR